MLLRYLESPCHFNSFVMLSTLVFAFTFAFAFTLAIGAVRSAATTPCSISADELDALEALYNSTNGGQWKFKNNSVFGSSIWKFPANTSDPCTNSWQGVECQLVTSTPAITSSSSSLPNCTIDKLMLSAYNLQGSLPSEIGLLTSLTGLDLSENHLTNSIPESTGNLTNLVNLALFLNSLNGW